MTVSIQQASANALAVYLRTALPDVTIEEQWPDPHKKLHLPTITLLLAGQRRDLAIDVRALGGTLIGANRVNTTYVLRACEQMYQIDVWAKSPSQRDDILARMDDVMNYTADGSGVNGLLLTSLPQDNWGETFFDYYCESPDTDDAPYTEIVGEFRATIVCHAWFNLTVNRETARQTIINFQQKLQDVTFT